MNKLNNPQPAATALPSMFGEAFRRQLGLLTENELAETIGVTTNTLVAWRTKRTGPPHIKFGRNIFYRAGDVAQYVSMLPALNAPDYDKLRAEANEMV